MSGGGASSHLQSEMAKGGPGAIKLHLMNLEWVGMFKGDVSLADLGGFSPSSGGHKMGGADMGVEV